MAKKNSPTQTFSLRRIFVRSVRITEAHRTQRQNDIESGIKKIEPSEKNSDKHSERISPSRDSTFNVLSELQDYDACNICFLNTTLENPFCKLDLCKHRFCKLCLLKYLKNEICESRTDIACPQCSSAIHPNNIEFLLKDNPDIKTKYEDFMMRRYLVGDPDSRWCPAPDCSYAVIASGCASCPEIKCARPNCGTSFCYHCKAIWHPDQTCDAARSSRQKILNPTSITFGQDLSRRDEIKPCPRCQVLIVKMNDGSCNHMACSLCGAEFCWLCMKEVTDLHYLSPSGCTFWGKKPWSRKKKIVWQIGTLIGAPVGIALLAGIAVPSIVIGIPVWAGRKLLNRYKATSKKRRNISVAIGVAASILIAPLLAGLAIAVGVPILLFYVYGVVPVSLFRAGCTKANNENYKFDYNISEVNKNQNNSDIVSVGAESKVGEISIGDVSLSAVSGSINDDTNNQLNIISYRESTIALAGSVRNLKIDYIDSISMENGSSVTAVTNNKSKIIDITTAITHC